MAWRIEVAESVRPVLAALDPSLREELLEHAALLADDPLALVHDGGAEEIPESLVYEYDSGVLHNTRVRLIFADARFYERRIVLVSLRTIGLGSGE